MRQHMPSPQHRGARAVEHPINRGHIIISASDDWEMGVNPAHRILHIPRPHVQRIAWGGVGVGRVRGGRARMQWGCVHVWM